MTATYDPALCAQLIASARDKSRWWDAPSAIPDLQAMADQLEAARSAELEARTNATEATLRCAELKIELDAARAEVELANARWAEHAASIIAERDELRRTVDALQEQIEAVAPVVDAVVAWRATPPVDAPMAKGGSTAPWVRAYRDLELAVDAYRARSKP